MRLDEQNVVVVESSFDIKQAIKEFLPGEEKASPEVRAKIKSGNKVYELSAPTECSYRDMLLEGFEIIKKRMEARDKHKPDSDFDIEPIDIDSRMWLDDLIERRLGGKREGLRVRWDVKDGIFYFDPFTGKLTQAQ